MNDVQAIVMIFSQIGVERTPAEIEQLLARMATKFSISQADAAANILEFYSAANHGGGEP